MRRKPVDVVVPGVHGGMEKHKLLDHLSGLGTFAFADVTIDARAHRLSRGGDEVAIEPKAFAVLLEFLTHPGQLLARDQLLDAVWGHNYVTPATLSRIVAQLRRALADDSENPHCIQTVHGLGYRFIAPLLDGSAEEIPMLRFAPPARARLPERTETLIGRERDIEALQQLLQENRLVTVAGPGGVGKTQAALETARRLVAGFPDGVWLFDCTPFDDGEALIRWLAGMFDIRSEAGPGELTARMGEVLQARRALLVFDNCERVAGPLGEALTALLAVCPSLRVLVTSQHRLNCAGESLYSLPPLDVPASAEWATEEAVASLSGIPAVRLLLMRSRASASSFALMPSNAGRVVEICRRLEGLPLALEIAAARLRLLSPEQLLLRMNDHLLQLAAANPGRPARHQTLHGMIAWSFALLSESEQRLLSGLGVFAGGCTLSGAQSVGAVFGLDEEQTLDLLGGLVDKSLLNVDLVANPPSYRLLDSVRLFALERLAGSGDETRVRDAHLAHFVALTEHVNAGIQGDRQHVWAERVRREWANLHAVFAHALTRPELAESALALVGNLCWYFRLGTNYGEAARWLEKALSLSSAQTRHRAQALIALGMMLHHQSVHERAGSCLREGIGLATALGETWLAGVGQAILAFELATCGDFQGAEVCVSESLAIATTRADPWLRSMALLSRGVAHALNDLHHEAERCLDEAFAAVSSPGSEAFQQAYTLINLALQRFYMGDARGAALAWQRDLDLFVGFQHWRGVAGCVEGAAYLAGDRGEAGLAARFLGAAGNMRRLTEAPLMPQWRRAQEAAERKIRRSLGKNFEAMQREGAAARFEEIAGEARAFLDRLSSQELRTGVNSPSGS